MRREADIGGDGRAVILITRDGERLVSALETIAKELHSHERIMLLTDRVELLESLLRNGARLMVNPQSTDAEWESWLARIQESVE